LFARDRDLEAIWRDRRSFVSLVKALQPSGVIAPSYSTWLGDLWPEHRYSMKRSFEFYRLLQDQGLVAIPHLAWGRQVDAADLVDWINLNEPDIVAVDAQCLGPLFDVWLPQLGWLCERLTNVPNLVVGGIRPGPRLERLVQVWPQVTFIYNGLRFAASHRELRVADDGRLQIVRHARPSHDLPNLSLDVSNEDVPAAVLYQRSLRVFEQSAADSGRPDSSASRRGGRAPHMSGAGVGLRTERRERLANSRARS
jgi:hypothetical protein